MSKLKKDSDKIEIINTLSKCIKIYDENLKNKKVMFIVENKKRKLEIEEMFFGKRNFYHLTGVKVLDKTGKELSSNNFYDLLLKSRINYSKFVKKDNTTDLKLQVLPQLMKIDRIANMIGEYDVTKIFLQTDKIAGNINACMGFVRDKRLKLYVPNTALKKDIRQITSIRNKIIAILKKDSRDKLYSNITYLKQNYNIIDILKNEEINKKIDIENIYSTDKRINSKISDFINVNSKILLSNKAENRLFSASQKN